MKPIQILRTGKHTDTNGTVVTFTESDLQASAKAYDPQLHEAPLVVGHPKTDAPAYGWVQSLQHVGPTMEVLPHQVDKEFAELVNTGRYKKISAAFYAPDSPLNPKPGVWYLRHVGFLGAQPPAIKGLKSASFAAGEEGVVIFADSPQSPQANRLWRFLELLLGGPPEIDTLMADLTPDLPAPPPLATAYNEQPKKEDPLMATQQELEERDAELKKREADLAQREAKSRTTEFGTFAEGLVKDTKIRPVHRSLITNLLTSMAGDRQVAFEEADKRVELPQVDALKKFLTELPKLVELGEVARAEQATPDVEFAAPAGSQVDADRMQLHKKALDYQAKNKCEYVAAVRAVGG